MNYLVNLISNSEHVENINIINKFDFIKKKRFLDYLRRCPNPKTARLLLWIDDKTLDNLLCVTVYSEPRYLHDINIFDCVSFWPCDCPCNCEGCQNYEKQLLVSVNVKYVVLYYQYIKTGINEFCNSILCKKWHL